MPLPLLFIGIAVASGMFGVGGTVKAGFDAKMPSRSIRVPMSLFRSPPII